MRGVNLVASFITLTAAVPEHKDVVDGPVSFSLVFLLCALRLRLRPAPSIADSMTDAACAPRRAAARGSSRRPSRRGRVRMDGAAMDLSAAGPRPNRLIIAINLRLISNQVGCGSRGLQIESPGAARARPPASQLAKSQLPNCALPVLLIASCLVGRWLDC